MRKLLVTLLACLAFVCIAIAAPAANPTVRVGLYYGNNALVSANLQNIVGSGYRFGFYDDNKNFSELFYLNAQRITMASDLNLYYNDGVFYTSGAPTGSKFIGAYHIQPDTIYQTAAEVIAEASALQMQGTPAIAAYVNGSFRLRIGFYSDITSATKAKINYAQFGNSIIVGANSNCITIINTANGTPLFEYDSTGGRALGVYPSKGDVGIPLTWFKDYKYHGGFQYIRNGGNITVINFLPMQEYVMGVVPYEMPPTWPTEALKAQAMCARTYGYYNFGKHGSAFDVCNTTDCQVYRGANSATESSNNAVIETNGKYILYDGKPISAVFHSSNGGATENSENVWMYEIPYLRGKPDPYEDLSTAINGRWSYEYTPEEITYILNAKGHKCARIVDAYVEEFTKTGNVYKVSFVDENGKVLSFTKENARLIMNSATYKKYTHSLRYNITRGGKTTSSDLMYINNASSGINPFNSGLFIKSSGEISPLPNKPLTILTANGRTTFGASTSSTDKPSGNFVFSGTGWGHNVGLSQNGAKAMALKGIPAEDIIRFYYTGVEITNAY